MKRALTAFALSLTACGGGSGISDLSVTPFDGGTHADLSATVDSSASSDGGTTPKSDMATVPIGDAGGFLVIESCAESDYVDARNDAALRRFASWDTSFGKKCLHISAGQTVTWPSNVPTASHPLEAKGGTNGNPIKDQQANTFLSAGTFGFDCSMHTTLMHGAISVD